MTPPAATPEHDSLARLLAEERERFAQSFQLHCERLTDLAKTLESGTAVEDLRRCAHQLAGLAGTVGYPSVSHAAGTLERLLEDEWTVVTRDRVMAAIEHIRLVFAEARTVPVPTSSAPIPMAPTDARILLVEDDAAQRAILASRLDAAGYHPIELASGENIQAVARREQPALILMDVGLPDVDGYDVCRRLKTSPDTARVPIVFLTARSAVADRLTGLSLGADDYIDKTADPRELVLRINRVLARGRDSASADGNAVPEYEAFVARAQPLCAAAAVALALVRLPPGKSDRAIDRLLDDLRRRDLIGRYDRTHVVVLMPQLNTRDAHRRMRTLIDSLAAEGVTPMHAGVVGTRAPGEKTWDALLIDADEALTDARYTDVPVSTRLDRSRRPDTAARPAERSAIIAEDDPEIVRIVDAHLRHGGFTTTVAFDGASALEAVEENCPDLLLLDLMMPKLTGFDVLRRLQGLERRPRTVVLSGKGREDDVMRAFELGADDYVTKPFNPQELLARVERLVR